MSNTPRACPECGEVEFAIYVSDGSITAKCWMCGRAYQPEENTDE